MPDLVEMRLSVDHQRAIGLAIARHSFLDSMVQLAIWRFLAASEEMGRAVTSNLTAANKLHLLRSLANERMALDSPQKVQLDTIMADIVTANDDRNLIAHVDFAIGDYARAKTVHKHTARGKVKAVPHVLPLETIRTKADKIGQTATDLLSFLQAHERATFFDPATFAPSP